MSQSVSVSKLAVRQAFDSAAQAYDSVADVQRHICTQLAHWLPQDNTSTGRLLDAGCGTGYAIPLLEQAFPHATLLALDLAPGMLRQPRLQRCQCIAGDMEALPLASNSLHGYWSSLALQWCNPLAVFQEIQRVLSPGGDAWVATLSDRTLQEIRSAFAGIDQADHVLHFLPEAELTQAITQAGLHIIQQQRSDTLAWAADARSQLQAIKTLGAGNVAQRRRGLLGKQAWQQVCQHLEQYRQPQGLPTTYDVIYWHLRKAA